MPKFDNNYLSKVSERIGKNISRLTELRKAATFGRVIPDEEDLDIGRGRPLNLAVLFLDICKFSAWPQGTVAEQGEVLNVFNVFMAEMMRIAEDYGGEVEKNTGDGLMAYFGGEGDLAAEDACKAAVGAALAMVYVGRNVINPKLTLDNFREVDFRLGVDYGPVTVAIVGGKRKFKSRVAIGATAIIANRILDDCGVNQIGVGEMVINSLPQGWKEQCKVLNTQTGWIYSASNKPYIYYTYTGRWGKPND